MDEPRHHGNRHGRSEAARQAVLAAADDVLVEVGFAGVTIERIAARAGVAKQTIYRWWPSKIDVLLDTFASDIEHEAAPPDHHDLAADLREYLFALASFLTVSDAGAVFRALLGQAQHDAELARRLRGEQLAAQHARDRLPFERAVARGELPADTDVDAAVEQVVAPLYYRVLVTGEPVPRAYTDALVERYLRATAVR